MSIRPVTIASFAPGVNNRLEPTKLDVNLPDRTKASYLYAADNVDIDEKGYIKRRRGRTLQISGATHSVWSDGAEAFVVVNGLLERITDGGAGLNRQSLGLMPKLPVSYSRGADGVVYLTNGATIQRVVAGTLQPIAAAPIGLVPGVTVTDGALPAGRYLVALTRVDTNGESPATPIVQVDVPPNGAIVVSSGEAAQLYLSGPDGDILTLQASGTVIRVDAVIETGRRLMTANRIVMPAGQIVRHYRGQMLVASGNVLWVSDPYNYGICNPSKSFIPFPARIDMIEPTDNGIYIAADKTYWLGNLFEDALQEVLPYGAIPRTSGRSPNDETVFWQTEQGLVIGDKNQAVKAAQQDALLFSKASSGASLYRERDGMTHIVTTRTGANPNTVASGSWMDAEIERKGTVL